MKQGKPILTGVSKNEHNFVTMTFKVTSDEQAIALYKQARECLAYDTDVSLTADKEATRKREMGLAR